MNALDGEILNGKHYQPVRVYYEDTDFSGIVYHASYLRFMERGRTNYLRLIGANHHELFAQAEKETPGFSFVVRTMTIDYLKPAVMDDVLTVVTTPAEVKGASATLKSVGHARRRNAGHRRRALCLCLRRAGEADSRSPCASP